MGKEEDYKEIREILIDLVNTVEKSNKFSERMIAIEIAYNKLVIIRDINLLSTIKPN
jgi:hypothetical protein